MKTLGFFLIALVAGCSGRKTTEADTPCNVYLECVNEVDRDQFERLRELYGIGGSCFADNDEAECHAMCEAALDALALANSEVEACDPDNIDPTGEDESESESNSGTGTTGGPGPGDSVQISEPAGVDIVLVIDNSGSMGEEQQNLSENIASLVAPLEGEGIDYRIGITTTDNGNYWCRGSGISNPEAGNFVFSSCRERINDFLFTGDNLDARFACNDFCPEAWGTIQQTATPTANDPTPQRRPWIESIGGVTNLPPGLDTATALQCLAPQGINGCGFEAHLESMYKALRRTNEEQEDEFGFLDDLRTTAILFLTDEADCSSNAEWEVIFLPENDGGNQVFWSLPAEQSSPTSAVCWNAGVTCSPDGAGTYAECLAVDKDFEGNEGVSEDAAVLFPVSRYVDFMQELENSKQQLVPGHEIIVGAIAGVPEQYPNAPIVYAQGQMPSDPNSFQAKFGIAAGCSSPVAEAVPPVRLRDFANAFALDEGGAELYSVCSPSYADALARFTDRIQQQQRPSCMPACVADTDPVTALADPNCALTQTWRDDSGAVQEAAVPQCSAGQLPDGTDVCWTALVDKTGQTNDAADDMSAECADEGWNLEFKFVRREGVPRPAGSSMAAECEFSDTKPIDCPDLP